MEIIIPKSAWPAIESLARLDTENFQLFLSVLRRAKPAASPDSFWKQIAKNIPQIEESIVRAIVTELFSMEGAIETLSMSSIDFAEAVSDAAFQEQPEEISITESDKVTLRHRLEELFELQETLGLTSKALDVLTDAQNLFYTAKILTDARPIFDDEGRTIKAAVMIHNLVIHYGDAGEHKNFFVSMDSIDLKELRRALDRAELKAKAIRDLLQRSETLYLDIEE